MEHEHIQELHLGRSQDGHFASRNWFGQASQRQQGIGVSGSSFNPVNQCHLPGSLMCLGVHFSVLHVAHVNVASIGTTAPRSGLRFKVALTKR